MPTLPLLKYEAEAVLIWSTTVPAPLCSETTPLLLLSAKILKMLDPVEPAAENTTVLELSVFTKSGIPETGLLFTETDPEFEMAKRVVVELLVDDAMSKRRLP